MYEDLITYAALALPVLTVVGLAFSLGWAADRARGARWFAFGVSVLPLLYLAAMMIFPVLDITNPDIFLGGFPMKASLLLGGLGGVVIVGIFALVAVLRRQRATSHSSGAMS